MWRLDRLGRNLTHVRTTIQETHDRAVHFGSLTEGLTNEGAMGKMMIDILGTFAEFEPNVMIERTQAGLAAAKGTVAPRADVRRSCPKQSPAEPRKLRNQGFTISRLTVMFRIAVPSVYHYLSS